MKDILAKWHWLLADPLCLERDEFGSRQRRQSTSTKKSAVVNVDGIFHDPFYGKKCSKQNLSFSCCHLKKVSA